MNTACQVIVAMLILTFFSGCLDSVLDDDDDGINNDIDNCKEISNPNQLDSDEDGIGDECDDDDDNDGVLDSNDSFPLDANETVDTDFDGIGDNSDDDDDGDGFSDIDEEQNCGGQYDSLDSTIRPPDYDGDEICDLMDSDDDGDGKSDSSDSCPVGIIGIESTLENDWDSDGCIDLDEDQDDDNDGTMDELDSFPFDPEATIDTDQDGMPDEITGGLAVYFDSFENHIVPEDMTSNNWYSDTGGLLAKDGEVSMRSAKISDDSFSRLYMNAHLSNGTLSFWYFVSSEDYDEFSFQIDSEKVLVTSGSIPWTYFETNISEGTHDLVWEYSKDVSGKEGADASWIDDLRLPIQGAPTITLEGNILDLDDDGDGYSDEDEITRCNTSSDPKNPNKIPPDLDGDKLCDELDEDDDGDDINDIVDAFPLDASEWLDTDLDGIGNNADNDDDNDGFVDDSDAFPLDPDEWLDTDSDGIGDNFDSDDDGDSWSDSDEAACLTDSLLESSVPTDTDSDGLCDIVDTDDDGDSFADFEDHFPLDPNEWLDTDQDGEGNNADTDDDGDLIPDVLDQNPLIDMAVEVSIGDVFLEDYVDFWDDYGEIFFNISLDGVLMGYISDGGETFSVPTGSWYSIDQSISFDLVDTQRYFWIGISAWDYDSGGTTDDLLDINPSSDYRTLFLLLDGSTGEIVNTSVYSSPQSPASGSPDYSGDDDDMSIYYSVDMFDMRSSSSTREYSWYFDLDGDGNNAYPIEYTFSLDLSYADYSYWRSLDHSVEEWGDYGRFVTPNADYIGQIADEFANYTESQGFSDTQIAEFVLAFVGSIDYAFDIDSAGMNEYPKYPIEMLWEENGDCEDAAALYASIMENLGFDVILVLMEIQPLSGEDWGGHAIPLVRIDGFQGTYDYDGDGAMDTYGLYDDETEISYYWCEATGFSGIGTVWWYDYEIWEIIDV